MRERRITNALFGLVLASAGFAACGGDDEASSGKGGKDAGGDSAAGKGGTGGTDSAIGGSPSGGVGGVAGGGGGAGAGGVGGISGSAGSGNSSGADASLDASSDAPLDAATDAADVGADSGDGSTNGPPTWFAYRANQITAGEEELFGVDVGSGIPKTPIKLNSTLAAGMDVNAFAWSPDGTRLSYRADQETDNAFALWLVDMSSSVPSSPLKIGPAPAAASSWSPDGKWVAYVTAGGLAVVNVSTSTPSTPVVVNSTLPAGSGITNFGWSPNAKLLAYRADQDLNGVFELYVVDLSSGTPSSNFKVSGNLPGTALITLWGWSPDSSRIAYRADQDTNDVVELYIADLGAGPPATLAKVSGAMASGGDVDDFAWSPDGARIAFSADKDTDEVDELYVVSFSGTTTSAPQKLNGAMTSGGDVLDFAWAPDSSWISFEADKATDEIQELFAVAMGGPSPGSPVKIASMPSSGDLIGVHRWSSDSKWIAFTGDKDSDEVIELFLIDMSGTPATPVKASGTMVANGDVTAKEAGALATPASSEFEFAPSATGLVYLADESVDAQQDLYFVDLTGAAPGTSKKVSAMQTPSGDVLDWSWSNDGSYVAYRGDQEIDGLNELFMSVLSTGTPTAPAKLSGAMPSGSVGALAPYRWQP